MKTKHLFYSLAMMAAFSACTQEELIETPVLDSSEIAGRPVAGVVTFVNGEADSRYNSEKAKFENGDQMGLYLMDEFTGIGEEANANDTYWTWQSCWWNMYNMVDYINTNYGYVYNAETGEWINRASQLVEGNYVAMFPQNTRATNRQDLWHPINANVDLVDHSSTPRYYMNRENQFFLGYEQIQRDQKAGEETGELRANVSMKPILTYAKFKLINEGNFNFKPKKVVFKAPGGAALPNVAYVRPSGIVKVDNHGHIAPWWAWTNGLCTDALKQTLKDECDNVLAWSKYDRTTLTHEAARSLVEYATTTEKIPYGMTETEAIPTYEYVFNFPADADILYGAIEATSVEQTSSTLSIALPMFEGWQQMEVVVYGEMQTDEDTYRPGILRKRTDVDNGVFTLNQLKPWYMGYDIPMSKVTFDHNYFYQQEELRVSTTEDLITLLTARLSDVDTSLGLIEFVIQHYGNGLEITKEVVDLIKKYESDNKVDVQLTFNNTDRVEAPVVFATENSISEFKYSNVNVVVEKPQTITSNISGISELRNFSTININNASLTAGNIVNEIGATISTNSAIVNGNIHNEAILALNNSTVNGSISNAATMTTAGQTIVNGLIVNDNACVNCGKDKAVLTINGVLVAEKLTNADTVVVNGTLNTALENNGDITINGLYNVVAKGVNNGLMTITKDGEVDAEDFDLINIGTINVEGDLTDNIKNSGYIYVKNNGHVIVNGIVEGMAAGIIDVTEADASTTAQAAKDMTDENYFRYTVQTETTSSELKASLETRISENNRNGRRLNAIILVWGKESATTYCGEKLDEVNVERVIINNNLTFVKGATTTKSTFINLNNICDAVDCAEDMYAESKAFVVNGTVTIANGAELILAEKVNVWIDGTLKANNNSNVTGANNVYGGSKGRVEIDSDVETFTWIRTALYKGQWKGKSVIVPGLIQEDSKTFIVYNADALKTAAAMKDVEDQVIRLAPGTYKSNIILSKEGDVRKTNVTFEPLYEGSNVIIDGQFYMDAMSGDVEFNGITFNDTNTPDDASDYENYNVERMNQAINTVVYSYYPKNNVVFDNCKFNVSKNGVRVYKDWHNHYGGKLTFVNSTVNVSSKVTDPINAIEISGDSDIKDNTFTGNVFAAVTISGGSDNDVIKTLNAHANTTNGFVVMLTKRYGCTKWTLNVDEDAKCGFDDMLLFTAADITRNGGNWNLYEE